MLGMGLWTAAQTRDICPAVVAVGAARPTSADRPAMASLPNAPFMRPASLCAAALAVLSPALQGCAPTRKAPAAASSPTPAAPQPIARVPVTEPTGMPLSTTARSVPAARGKTLAVRVDDPELVDEFNNIFATGDLYLAGWPSEEGLKRLAARGVKRIVALKTPDEVMHARGYDARAVAKQLGMELVVLPVRPDTYSPADVDAFAKAINESNGPVLVHCGSASTSAMVWSGYLARQPDATTEGVMGAARGAGLLEGPMADAAERVANEIIGAKPAPKPRSGPSAIPSAVPEK